MQESLFVDRVRDYLNYKGLNYQEKALAVYDMLRRIPEKVGAAIPLVQTHGVSVAVILPK